MTHVFVVSPEEAELARKIEKKLIALPEAAGILFVSTTVLEDPSTSAQEPSFRGVLYRVVVGCQRARDPSLINMVVRKYLLGEVPDHQLIVESHRGIDKANLDD